MTPPPRAETLASAASVGVLICTYRRPEALSRCLAALTRQTRLPDDVLVVHRADDTASLATIQSWRTALPVRAVPVAVPGVVAARNAGLRAGRSDILAQIDDDTAPHPDWCARLVAHFDRDPTIGGLCGRDRVHDGEDFDEHPASRVGVLQFHGRLIGNHHRGHGAARTVDLFKGANMAFRASATRGLWFDTRLAGQGAQPHEDVAFSLAVRRRGWRLLYDPAVLVDHYAGRADQRPYSSVGAAIDMKACEESGFNMVVALWDELSPARRLLFLAWSVIVGTGPEPGMLQAIRYTPRSGLGAWRRFAATQRGKFRAAQMLLAYPRAAGGDAAPAGAP